MTGRPDYMPSDVMTWAEVLPYSWSKGGYPIQRVTHTDGRRDSPLFLFGAMIQESDAELFAKMKNDLLMQGRGI